MKPINIISKLNEDDSVEVTELKKKLQDLADKDFYHNMKDHWTQEDFQYDTELGKEIIQVIRDLAKYGVIANYRMGYDIEYKKEEK